jgi:hypothetical protein
MHTSQIHECINSHTNYLNWVTGKNHKYQIRIIFIAHLNQFCDLKHLDHHILNSHLMAQSEFFYGIFRTSCFSNRCSNSTPFRFRTVLSPVMSQEELAQVSLWFRSRWVHHKQFHRWGELKENRRSLGYHQRASSFSSCKHQNKDHLEHMSHICFQR